MSMNELLSSTKLPAKRTRKLPPGKGMLAGYLTLAGLADELAMHPRTIRRLVLLPNGLPYVRLAARLFFDREAVARWIAGRSQQTPAGRPRGAAKR
jgi:hypothetical protein